MMETFAAVWLQMVLEDEVGARREATEGAVVSAAGWTAVVVRVVPDW